MKRTEITRIFRRQPAGIPSSSVINPFPRPGKPHPPSPIPKAGAQNQKKIGFPWILIMVLALINPLPVSSGTATFTISIKNHQFNPVEVRIPSGQKVKLIVLNQDSTPEEFESYELNREKVIPGNSSAFIFIGPLKPGRYKFFGDFHKETAQGVVIAEE